MPVNTAALKTFAPAMRRQLLEAVGRKLDLLLNSQTPDTLSTYAKQIAELREQEAENREQLLERVAYTWFNRLCALRYLDAKGWHPFGCNVLMPAAEGEIQPELLKLMRAGNLPAALKDHTDESRLHGLLDGQIQPAVANTDPQGEVYRELVLAASRSYHELLPTLFEGLDDASELLLPDDLLSDSSIAGGFRSQISDRDCQDVEILGWLYQFYLSEKKDEVMARKKAVPTEDIPAVTQLFTPHWIARYLVENSLARLWLLNRPKSKLRERMAYYIEAETETDFPRITKPEEIKLLDPACGSGHMLTYAFDLLVNIYTEERYAAAEIPGLILQNNLYGMDICPRAAQLTSLALVLKARELSRRFFQPQQLVQTQIIKLQDVRFQESELNDYIEALDLSELFDPNLLKLLCQFKDTKTLGSLVKPCLDKGEIAHVRYIIEAKDLSSQLFPRDTHLKVQLALEQAEALAQQYQVVVANPPYIGTGAMTLEAKEFAKLAFPRSKTDTFAMFIERSLEMSVEKGFAALVTMHSWMFLASFEELRRFLIMSSEFSTLIHIGPRGFDSISGEVVQTVGFVLQKLKPTGNPSSFIRLVEGKSESEKTALLQKAITAKDDELLFRISVDKLGDIPGSPIAYWLPPRLRACFGKEDFSNYMDSEGAVKTGDNARFIRFAWEVNAKSIGAGSYWRKHPKGGGVRRWYGNLECVVNWSESARRHYREDFIARIPTEEIWDIEGITWSAVSSGDLSFRFTAEDEIANNAALFVYPKNPNLLVPYLCCLNCSLTKEFLRVISPTVNCLVGDVLAVPFPPDRNCLTQAGDLGKELISIARADWDNFETSWDFRDQPLLREGLKGATLEVSWRNWEAQGTATIQRMQELEIENNRLFIAAYGLEGELQPEVPDDRITLARAEQRKDMAAFISYAAGCMMGRYSLDKPGLILANAGDTLEDFKTRVGKSGDSHSFHPDPDGIIPVLDGEWFEDDIVARTREFLAITFPESSVAENLRFIEESLGKDIRKYFCSDFYKDHLQTYKKRPIYWMVQSPKKGFACLIYLHRYTKDTLNQVLNNYFRPYLQKLEARLAQLEQDQINDDLKPRERNAARKEAEKITKVLKECQAWEQDALLPLAQQRIELDLDDGVKVNYLKLQDVLAKIPGLAAKED